MDTDACNVLPTRDICKVYQVMQLTFHDSPLAGVNNFAVFLKPFCMAISVAVSPIYQKYKKIYLVTQGCQKVFKQQADNEQQAALELTQVLEGQAIQGHFENQSLGNGVSKGFQDVFPTADAMLFRQNTRKPGNNAVNISLALRWKFHDTLIRARISHFKKIAKL